MDELASGANRLWSGLSVTMGRASDQEGHVDLARALVEELLRTAFALEGVLASLLEQLPEDAFPGDDSAAVLVEMVAGTCRPAVEAAGDRVGCGAVALIGAVRDRVLGDLKEAAVRAARSDR
ncbi:MAG: hypothetical protein ACRDN8_13970 [Thermoleophilaceae bacterium]